MESMWLAYQNLGTSVLMVSTFPPQVFSDFTSFRYFGRINLEPLVIIKATCNVISLLKNLQYSVIIIMLIF